MNKAIRILGIDPGLRRTGWGLVQCEGSRLAFIASGTATADVSAALASRLAELYAQIERVVSDHAPDAAAVEQTFVNKDASATLKLGQARGVALLAPARAGIQVAEYAPNAVKKTVIGSGHGGKEQIRMMVKVLLPRATFDSDDAADALAVAITHAHHLQSPAAMLARSA